MADENDDSTDDGITQEELERQAQQAVEDGRALQKITQLLQDNYEQREQLRDLRGQLPDDGEVVLSPGQAEQLEELGAIGEGGTVQAENLQERLEEGEDAQEELQAYRRREQRREVYEVEGLNEGAAEDILPDDLDFEVEEGEGEEEDDQAFVKTEDGRTAVADYIEEKFSTPIQKALTGEVGGDESGDDPDEESGTKSVPEQTPAGEDNPGPNEPGEEEIKQQKRSQMNYGL